MNNLTERIMSVLALEERETLPKEWFTRVCKCCFDKYTPEVDAGQLADNCWREQPILPRDHHIYTGPDLTDPHNLHALLLVCDAVSGECAQVSEVLPAAIVSLRYSHSFFIGRERDWVTGIGPTRTTAALDALCKALGVEK